MKRVTYQGLKYGVGDIDLGDLGPGKMLEMFDPDSGEILQFPLAAEDARNIAALLSGTNIQVVGADSLPPEPPIAA